MRVLCNRCKNIFYTEEHSFCPFCGQTGKLPTEADYSASKPLERKRSLAEEHNIERRAAELKNTQRRANINSAGQRARRYESGSRQADREALRSRERSYQEEREQYRERSGRLNEEKPHTRERYEGREKGNAAEKYSASEKYGESKALVWTVKALVFIAVTLVVFFTGAAGGFILLSSYTSGTKNVAEDIRPIDSFYSGVEEGFSGYPVIATAFPPYMTDNGTDTMKITYFESFNTVYSELKSITSDDYSIEYTVLSKTKLTAQRLEEIKTDLSTKMTTNINLSSGQTIATKALVTAGEEQKSINVTFTTIYLNNTWYIYDLTLAEE